MATTKTLTVTTRVPREVEHLIREAAAADGITVSAWISRRLRNNLRRTGRLADTRPPVSEAGAVTE